MEIVEGNVAPFSNSNLLYIHCVDSNVKFEYSFSEAASLSLVTILGHVSLPSELRSRRLVLFLSSSEIMDNLKDNKSPVVCRVRASCFFEMDEGKTVILISKIQVMDNQSLVAAPLCPRNDYGTNDIPEMPWFDCDSVMCNCSNFPLLGNVIIHSVDVFSRNVMTEVDEDEDIGNVPDDTLPAPVDNDNEDNLDPAIILYTEYMKLKGCTYHDHFQTVLKSCKLRLQASNEINLRLFYEPANVADENAVVAQVLQDENWLPIGYIPGKKVQKVLNALQSSSIKVIKFKKIEYSYIWSISAFKYIPTLLVTKEGRWPRDNENYSYND